MGLVAEGDDGLVVAGGDGAERVEVAALEVGQLGGGAPAAAGGQGAGGGQRRSGRSGTLFLAVHRVDVTRKR